MFIDTHAHLNFREFADELDNAIRRSFDVGVKKIINVGSNYQTSVKAIQIACSCHSEFISGYRQNHISKQLWNDIRMHAAVGCHPIHLAKDIKETAIFDGKDYTFTTKKEEFKAEKYQKLIDENKDRIVAIGETGLDYFRLNENNQYQKSKDAKDIQQEVFIAHINLAYKNNLPLILHCRGSENEPFGAYDEMLRIIKNINFQFENGKPKLKNEIRGVIHCFVGTLEQAQEFIDLGFYIGVNGILTFKKSIELQNIIKKISIEKIVLETDCPYLAPEPYRGKRNEPMYIPDIANFIGVLKNIPIDKVANITSNNAKKLFNI